MSREIPDMTHPLGEYWSQPNKAEINISGGLARMPLSAFNKLKDYSSSNPSGVYVGKMWKSKSKSGWLLCWYEDHPTNPELMAIARLRIATRLIVEVRDE